MRLALVVVPLLLGGCHRPWLQPSPPEPGYPAPPRAGGSWGAPVASSAASQPAPYQPASYAPGSVSPVGPAGPVVPGAPAPEALGVQVAQAAQALEGKPYCWGGSGPDCYDCSGLATAAWASVGIVLPRTSDAQRAELRPIHWSEVRPGDVLWRPGHVGLYVERGWAIHAPGEGKPVQYQPAQTYELALRPL